METPTQRTDGQGIKEKEIHMTSKNRTADSNQASASSSSVMDTLPEELVRQLENELGEDPEAITEFLKFFATQKKKRDDREVKRVANWALHNPTAEIGDFREMEKTLMQAAEKALADGFDIDAAKEDVRSVRKQATRSRREAAAAALNA